MSLAAAAQAYGAQQYEVMGLILQRATIMCLLLSAFIVAGWTQIHWLLPLLGMHPIALHACIV